MAKRKLYLARGCSLSCIALFPRSCLRAGIFCIILWGSCFWFCYNPNCAGSSLKDLRLKWHLHFKSKSFKSKSFCRDIALYPTYPSKASLHKGGSLRPPPLWEILYGGWLSRDRWEMKQCHDKNTCFWKFRFWNVGAISRASLSKIGPPQVGQVPSLCGPKRITFQQYSKSL